MGNKHSNDSRGNVSPQGDRGTSPAVASTTFAPDPVNFTPNARSRENGCGSTSTGTINETGSTKNEIVRMLRKYLPQSNPILSREQFHIGLQISEDVGLRRLRNTPIANRLYSYLLKKECQASGSSSDGVSEESFINLMNTLYCGASSERFDLTFRVYDLDESGSVSRTELFDLLSESWLEAWQALAEKCDHENTLNKSQMSSQKAAQFEYPSRDDLLKFAATNKAKIHTAIERDIERLFGGENIGDNGLKRALSTPMTRESGSLSRTEFKRWCEVDRTMVAQCGMNTVQVAVGFVNIENQVHYPKF